MVKGYNEYFVKTDSIAAAKRTVYGAYEWASETFSNLVGSRAIQDASITNAKIGTAAIGTANIGTLTFNQLSGGTATFGGTSNGDGVINVLDEGGTQVGKWDKDGIEVKTTAGTTIIDGGGLISTANFSSNSIVTIGSTRSTSSTSFVDVPSTSLTFSLPRTTNVLFLAGGDFSNFIADGETCRMLVGINIGGTLFPQAGNGYGIVYFADDVPGDDVTNVLPTWSGHYLATLGAGTHTAKLQFCKSNVPTTSVNARVTNTQLTYLILGT